VALGLGGRTSLTAVAPDAALPQRRVSHGGNAAEVLPALHLDDDGVADDQWYRAIPGKELFAIALESDFDDFSSLNVQ
jgi:hypothetical protein